MEELSNNYMHLIGTIISELSFDHEYMGEKFWRVSLRVYRTSGQADIIPLLVSERLIDVTKNYVGCTAAIIGQFRSYNRHDGAKNHLILLAFVREAEFLPEFTDYIGTNHIFLDGHICREPVYRKTPFGREITDILLAVNRAYGKSDYIPCIVWGRDARWVESFGVGTRIKITGRIQSREYTKKISDTDKETRIAYEVSVSRVEEAYDEQKND